MGCGACESGPAVFPFPLANDLQQSRLGESSDEALRIVARNAHARLRVAARGRALHVLLDRPPTLVDVGVAHPLHDLCPRTVVLAPVPGRDAVRCHLLSLLPRERVQEAAEQLELSLRRLALRLRMR